MNGRVWKIALVGSLVLNAFLVGGLAGGAYQWFTAQRMHVAAPAPHVALRFATEGLSAQRQAQFLEALRTARRDNREYAREGRVARREVPALLAAPQLDGAALDAALARTSAADAALRAAVEPDRLRLRAHRRGKCRSEGRARAAHCGGGPCARDRLCRLRAPRDRQAPTVRAV